MSRRVKIILGVTILPIALFALKLGRRANTETQIHIQLSNQTGSEEPIQNIQPVAREINQTASSVPSGSMPDGPKQRRLKQKDRILPVFREVQRLRTYPTMADRIPEAYSKLVSDQESIEEFKNILLSLDDTRKLYGADQAVARINAINALGYLATKGHFDPIESVIEGQSNRLQTLDKPSQGDLADLSDLLTEWIKAKGVDQIEKDIRIITQRFPYSPKLQDAFLDALWNTFGRKTNQPEMFEAINRTIRGE